MKSFLTIFIETWNENFIECFNTKNIILHKQRHIHTYYVDFILKSLCKNSKSFSWISTWFSILDMLWCFYTSLLRVGRLDICGAFQHTWWNKSNFCFISGFINGHASCSGIIEMSTLVIMFKWDFYELLWVGILDGLSFLRLKDRLDEFLILEIRRIYVYFNLCVLSG